MTLLTCTDYRKSDGEEITVTAYLYNKEGIEKVITALKPLKSKRPISEIVKIIQKMLAPNTACQDNLDCIARMRFVIFDLYMITMHSLQQKRLPVFENITDFDLRCDAILYLYDSFKPHQEVDQLINKWNYTWVLLEHVISPDNYDPAQYDNKRARSPIEKPFHTIFSIWSQLYEPDITPKEGMREKRRLVHRHFAKFLKKINRDRFSFEKLEGGVFSHANNYNYIMVMLLMVSSSFELPNIFQKLCTIVARRYFTRSSEAGWNLFETTGFFIYLFIVNKGFYVSISSATSDVWSEYPLPIHSKDNGYINRIYYLITIYM